MNNASAIWDDLLQDVRFGWRMMLARPGFTAVAVLSIALGIGATTTIFSVVYAVLIDPYPYRAADRIGGIRAQSGPNDMRQPLFSPEQYLEIVARASTLEESVAVQYAQTILTGKDLLPQSVTQVKGSPEGSQLSCVGRMYEGECFPEKQFLLPSQFLSDWSGQMLSA